MARAIDTTRRMGPASIVDPCLHATLVERRLRASSGPPLGWAGLGGTRRSRTVLPRRYLLEFVTDSEAEGLGGLVGLGPRDDQVLPLDDPARLAAGHRREVGDEGA